MSFRGHPGFGADWTFRPSGFPERHPGTEPDPEPFRGTVICQVKQFDMVVHTEECGDEQPFPWPDQTLDGRLTAVVWLESDDQPVSPLAYEATVWTQMIHFNVDVDPGPPKARCSNMFLGLSDFKFHDLYGVVPTPFSAQPNPYLVECRSNRRGGFRPCLNDGTARVPRTPGRNTLQIRVTAPDGAPACRRTARAASTCARLLASTGERIIGSR